MPEDLLGRLPSLHILRHQFPGFVRTLRRYYAVARLLPGVHVRITLLASRTDPQSCDQGYQRGLSVLARVVSRRAVGAGTTPGRTGTRVFRSRPCCLPVASTRSAPGLRFSKLNSPARRCLCLHFTRHLAAPSARLEVKMVRYSFLVGLFHPRLHAGLSRRLRLLTRAVR